jgi:aminoglycoside phosphotransferase (APT) family kinase protein
MFVTVLRMHADEVDTDVDLVRRLLLAQHPQWADLPIEPVASYGTDHAIYRLGDDMSVRLPRIGWATAQPERECTWLPKLAPHLPTAIPVPLAKGEPGKGYPSEWVVSPWLAGEDATPDRTRGKDFALDLARFIKALHSIDTAGAPRPDARNFFRGVPLAMRDERLRGSFRHWDGVFETFALMAAWDEALAAPTWDGPPVWLHGDLSQGNVLVEHGRLSGVIDFGCMGVGDPACDLSVAWTILPREHRHAFREALEPNDATWARARGWALMGAGALPYYAETFPLQVARARHSLTEVLADFANEKGMS